MIYWLFSQKANLLSVFLLLHFSNGVSFWLLAIALPKQSERYACRSERSSFFLIYSSYHRSLLGLCSLFNMDTLCDKTHSLPALSKPEHNDRQKTGQMCCASGTIVI
uniref:Putative secreted protein n=1 Tax=Anopheles darlingi TaxID=43151 RepID=A0A2M4D5L5_ANODA